jgi:hypothetical protein
VKATHATSRTTLTLHRPSETRTGARIVSRVRCVVTVVGSSSRPSGIAATRTRFLQFGHSMEFPSYRSSAWASCLHSGQVKVITAKFGGADASYSMLGAASAHLPAPTGFVA